MRLGITPTRSWSPEAARAALLEKPDWKDSIRRTGFHPFDERLMVYDRRLVDWGRWDFMPEINPSNIALTTTRMTKDSGSIFCTEMPIGHKFSSVYDLSYAYPLRLRSRSEENLSPAFRDFIDDRYGQHYDPEQVLGYIYAVLHAPTYRTRYAEFLRIDFPRIPFAETPEQFEALSVLGWALIQTHLLKTVPRSKPRLGDYTGKGDHMVEAVRYSPEEQTVWINKTQGFANLPQAVWDFHIGGYQVIDKYLKSRKGRVLNLDEQTHVGNIAEALQFTIAQMGRIDAEYLKAFPPQ